MGGTELAKAYVQIVPSAKNIKSSIGNVLNNDAGSAGDDAGKIIGTNLVSKIKTLLVTAGIGKALQAALTEGAALQQSLGGIETLFGESANKVKENAAIAYRTAGMSANQYMETVAGFSASLLQGLAGDTNKAADIADIALTDMSDNANKMGTSMELIQNAYQGFAKQNYTMLDNLKLGYGGTKTEMQRLLKDAQKISGVKYNINNLSDVYSAIHVIQEKMGIMGTTANEASETLSGSFAAMKAAAKDFIGNLAIDGSVDVEEAFGSVYHTANTFLFGNLLPMVGQFVSGIFKTLTNVDWYYLAQEMIVEFAAALGGTAKQVMKNDGNLVEILIAAIEDRLPAFLEKGSQMVINFVNGIYSKIPKVLESAGTMLSVIIDYIMQKLPLVLETGVKLILSLVNGMITNYPKIASAAINLVAKLVTTIGKNAPKLLESGITLLGKLAAGLIMAVPDMISKIPGIITKIKKEFNSIDWSSIGKNIIKGIARGISNGVSSIISAAKTAARNALASAKQALGIHSPSKAFEEEVGEQSDEGWALGIKKNASIIMGAVKKVSKDTLGVANSNYSLDAFNSANYESANTIQSTIGKNELLDGTIFELVNQIVIEGRVLKEIVSKYVIETIDGQQKAVLRAKGAF